jgi:DNA-binding NarL/FixJ family response regulator
LVLVDSHPIMRESLRCFLEQSARFNVLREVTDGLRVAGTLARLKPQVALVVFELPGLSALDVPLAAKRRALDVPVVILSDSLRDAHVVQAFRNGAAAYVAKQANQRELPEAIRRVAKGERFISSPLSRRPLAYWRDRATRGPEDPYDNLTLREREVLHLVGQGLSRTEIAQQLGVSPRTVETHRENIKGKLGLRSHAELVRYVIERQLTQDKD